MERGQLECNDPIMEFISLLKSHNDDNKEDFNFNVVIKVGKSQNSSNLIVSMYGAIRFGRFVCSLVSFLVRLAWESLLSL
ncbi:23789_t:CDS:2 [Gigaspora rosea]|nr:23789_t:CDS:2 [Gigaspora rosea]